MRHGFTRISAATHGGDGSLVTTNVAHGPQGVLHTRDAQMDAGALDAAQKRAGESYGGASPSAVTAGILRQRGGQ
ncbi:hypothetical protein SBA7_290012 [Candidatus Sulfotelmatobacter sp. SbA7]|nr:hypothetical protein SBA7_290012 [Candidatus Sulfotelmatobacter sp. SbA7]